MSLERRPHHPGGFHRSRLRLRKNTEAAERANNEVEVFRMGEPSEAFFPPSISEVDESGENVIFLAERKRKRQREKPQEEATIATPQDVENRYKEQMERYIEYEHNVGHPASLPIGWMRYGVRHWEEIQRMKGH